jgi:hypothetical protein
MIKRLINISIILLVGISLSACNVNNTTANQPQQAPVQQEVMYHKTIDVKVTSIQEGWGNNREKSWNLKVRSDEYNLEKMFTVISSNMNSMPYAYEIYCGKVKANSVIKCELYSWKQGEIVTRRELGNLVY